MSSITFKKNKAPLKGLQIEKEVLSYEIFEAFGHSLGQLLNMEMALASYILWGVSNKKITPAEAGANQGG